jgi:hypothetical protein
MDTTPSGGFMTIDPDDLPERMKRIEARGL